ILATRAKLGRTRAEDVRSQHEQQGGLVDRLGGELRKEAVAPVEQVIDIIDDDALLVRTEAKPCDRVRVERILLVPLERCGVSEQIPEVGDIDAAKLHVPPDAVALPLYPLCGRECFGERNGFVRGRVEDVVVPTLRRSEALLAPEVVCD